MRAENSDSKRLFNRFLRHAAQFYVSHFAGTYIGCLVFCVQLGWRAPLAGLMLTALVFIPLLLIVFPYAAVLLFLLKTLKYKSKCAFASAGSVVGCLALATLGYLMPAIWQEGDAILLSAGAIIGGAVAGLLYRIGAMGAVGMSPDS